MRIRPMEERDVPATVAIAHAAFSDLHDRLRDGIEYTGSGPHAAAIRHRRLLATDPGGAWVAEDGGVVVGVALALVREGLWALSLFTVLPEAQSRGVGRELLSRAWAHGDGADARVILASRDVRALRAYVRLGLDLHPALDAVGHPRDPGIAPDGGVRPWQPGDCRWADAVAREIRGAAHGDDLDALLAAGASLTVVPGRGYAAARGPELKLLIAADEDAAVTLLCHHFAAAEGEAVTVEWITSAQQWAVRTCVAAGLDLHAHGAVMTAGRLGPLAPFLPNGAYL
jgi:ribosomal protein S18 acetylase RimI-like enzyme